jgi:ParB family transcriptional regulator, chromosome partitioning protein
MQVEEAKEDGEVLLCSIKQLDSNPFASRLEPASANTLVSSLTLHGQLSPIMVRRSPKEISRYEIVFGHRRVAAAKILGWKKITARIVEVTDEQMLRIALVENIDRRDFTDYEIGLALRRMKEDFNKSLEEVAEAIGRSVAYVSEHIKLTHLFDSDQRVSAEVSTVLQKISIRQSRILLREPDVDSRFRLAQFCLAEGLGEQEMNKLVGHPRPRTIAKDRMEQPNRSSSKNDDIIIKQMIRECIEGLNNKDVRPQFGIRDPKSFSMFDDFPPFGLLNFDAAAEHLCSCYKRFEEIHLDYDSLQVKVVGNTAYAVFFVTYRLRFDGRGAVGRSRATFVFSKVDGKWQAIHEHWSPYNSDYVSARLINPQIEIA